VLYTVIPPPKKHSDMKYADWEFWHTLKRNSDILLHSLQHVRKNLTSVICHVNIKAKYNYNSDIPWRRTLNLSTVSVKATWSMVSVSGFLMPSRSWMKGSVTSYRSIHSHHYNNKHSFIHTYVYIHTLTHTGVSDSLLAKLQTVQNAAARIITGTRKFDHITPVLCDLYWLPVRQRISFKLAMMVYKCLHGLAPSYLADICTPVSSVVGRWQLRSANSGTLVVLGTRTTIGQRNFVVFGPATWNRLPVELQTSSLSIDTFAKKLKSHLFSCKHLWRLLFIRRYTNRHIHWLTDWYIHACTVDNYPRLCLEQLSTLEHDIWADMKTAVWQPLHKSQYLTPYQMIYA